MACCNRWNRVDFSQWKRVCVTKIISTWAHIYFVFVAWHSHLLHVRFSLRPFLRDFFSHERVDVNFFWAAHAPYRVQDLEGNEQRWRQPAASIWPFVFITPTWSMQCCHNVDATFSTLQQRCVNIWSYYAWLRCALMAELIVPALRNISKRHLWDFDAPENMNSTRKISTTHTKRFRRGKLRDVASCSTLRIKCLDVWKKKIPKMSVWCSVFTTAYLKKRLAAI